MMKKSPNHNRGCVDYVRMCRKWHIESMLTGNRQESCAKYYFGGMNGNTKNCENNRRKCWKLDRC